MLVAIHLLIVVVALTCVDSFKISNSIRTFSRCSMSFSLLGGIFSEKGKDNKLPVEDIKTRLIQAARNTQNGVSASDKQREEINQLTQQLERRNRVPDIAKSKLVDGSWQLLYTTNQGSSAGKLGPFVGKVIQDIKLEDQSYINNVYFLDGIVKASLSATWKNESAKVWTVKFGDLSLNVLGLPAVRKSLGGATGTWRNVYLDRDMRILYAIGGKNTTKENIYILVRQQNPA